MVNGDVALAAKENGGKILSPELTEYYVLFAQGFVFNSLRQLHLILKATKISFGDNSFTLIALRV